MTDYARMYRLGVRPWERYPKVAAADVAAVLDGAAEGRGRPPGRALDLGCGRGIYTRELARRGWEAVGVDAVPQAVEEARDRDPAATATYVVGDVTRLRGLGVGPVDLFLDVGCFQGLDAADREAMGREVTAVARPGATLLMMAFGVTRWRSLIGGVSRQDVADAFPAWDVRSASEVDLKGLHWPMNRSSPRWYRLVHTGRSPG
ncbi:MULTISPECIES: bifunctional 2-polyprenyl-6-hydroxyphenol methylase/3-demethylubiquinol 3-O-methyltransferase UbiG [unclassified Isoptericola]|uniref:class I SAM-dependent methyltransferase n=1 Tax=unclassified Isoptericola TaxID=2623355 RepID=UPI0027136964|nr:MULTISPECIES: class I SAM-dependent methyltransferase [unclassified Isoptericola]MDO8145163.1 class I SAM-dependent methyltransferase [Isoptericola sp. 178]MDO8151259.1 class I SAM-dependent methyltransferase [Isoptericola sp. b408]